MENNVNEQQLRDGLHKAEYILFLILVILGCWLLMVRIRSWVSTVTPKDIPPTVIIKTADPFTSVLSTSTTKIKIAFTSDQGNTLETRKALALVREEQAEALIVLGNFDYENNPDIWRQNLNDHLGQNFPVIAVAGNYEEESWNAYAPVVVEKLSTMPKGICQSETPKDIGLTFHCNLGPVHMVLVTPDLVIAQSELRNPAAYIQKIFRSEIANRTFVDVDSDKPVSANDPWRLCGWNKVHPDMQFGNNNDVVHWDIYEACRKFGAYIFTGNDHVYARSKTVLDFQKNTVATSTPNEIRVSPGSTGVSMVGLGGISIQAQKKKDNNWWASTYTSEDLQGESKGSQKNIAGITFCTFDKDASSAPCYFKTTDGKVRDEFTLIR